MGAGTASKRPYAPLARAWRGITAAQFRSLLSPKDIKDIEAGAIHHKTLKAYAHSFVEGLRSGRLVPVVASP